MRDLANVWRRRQEFEGTDHPGFRLQNLTTAQRDALTGSGAPKAGDSIFNTDVGGIQAYDGGAWQDVRLQPVDVGAVTTSATSVAAEGGDDVAHTTQLTLTGFLIDDSGDAGDLAIGASLYTFPAGAIIIESVSLHGSFTADISDPTIADGEWAIGTLIASGAEDALGDVDADAENVLGPAVLSNAEFDGTELETLFGSPALYIAADDMGVARELFLNVAATWADVTAAGPVTFDGVITVKWRKIS